MSAVGRLGEFVDDRELVRFQAFFFIQFVAFSGFAVFRNVYLEEMGMTGYQMGLVGFVMTLSGVLAQPVWGLVTDYGGVEKAVLVTGALVSAAGLLLYPVGDRLAEPFLVVAVGTGIYSVFRAPIVPIANSLVLSKGFDYGKVRAFGSIAFGIGSLGFGYLVASLGTVSTVYFYALGMLALVAVVRGLPVEVEGTTSEFENPLSLVSNPDYLVLLVVAFLMGMTMRGGSAFFSVYMREIAAGDALTGIAWTIKTVFEAAVFLYVVRTGLSYKWLLVVGGIGTAVPNFVYAATTVPAFILGIQAISGLGYATFSLASVNLAHALASKSLKSTAQTVLSGAGLGAGGAIGQVVAGRLVDLVGVQDMYVYVGGIGLAAAAVGLFVRRSDGDASGEA